jgi:DNA-directed RNA polymerase specialized sigma24 family protein
MLGGTVMPWIRVQLENGESWLLSHNELVISPASLEDLSAAEIGEKIISLRPFIRAFREYLSERHEPEDFDSLDEFRQALREQSRKLTEKGTRHSSKNYTWQIDYEAFTLDDFFALLLEDTRLPLVRPHVRQAIEILITHPDFSWREMADILGLSAPTVQEKVRHAVREFRERQQNPNYQDRNLR